MLVLEDDLELSPYWLVWLHHAATAFELPGTEASQLARGARCPLRACVCMRDTSTDLISSVDLMCACACAPAHLHTCTPTPTHVHTCTRTPAGVVGISLYTPRLDEISADESSRQRPWPASLHVAAPAFLMQLPSSWGALYFRAALRRFGAFYEQV